MNDNPYQSPNDPGAAEAPFAEPSANQPPTGMTGRDLFGVVVRTLGLLAVFWGVYYSWGLFFPAPGRQRTDYLMSVILYAGFGLFNFLFADAIVGVAYRREKH